MIVYMLKYGDKFYQRRSGRWVEQQKAAVWSTRQGPVSAKGSVLRSERKSCEIVKFKLETL